MKRLFVAILFAVLSSGCAFRTADRFAVSDEFSAEQLEAIAAAADAWCKTSGNCAEIFIVEKDTIPSISKTAKISIGTPESCRNAAPEGSTLTLGGRTALSSFADPHIFMCLLDDDFGVYVMHEMGHALSGRDDHTHEGVMSAPWDWSLSLTEADVAYVHGEPVRAD